jgi:MoxR-like ATPase
MAVSKRIESLLEQLYKGIYEKKEIMKLALLSSIAGESIFLLGPPGVAKSLIARKLKYAYKDAKAFEYLMSRFSTPDEIFGPVSIKKLKEEDKYERIVKNYLPDSSVVFLDEIWKAGPSIQNALLTILNEKIYRNGEEEIKVPLKALISASNELPAKDEGLEAMWDRFLVRFVVENIADNNEYNNMITATDDPYEDTITNSNKIAKEEYEEWDKAINEIKVSEHILYVIRAIRSYINSENEKIKTHNEEAENKENKKELLNISDRRWRKIIRLLRTSAFLNDREDVDLMDCFLIQYCIWNEKEQIDIVRGFVRDALEKHGYTFDLNFGEIKKELDEFKAEIDEETKFIKDTRVKVLAPVYNDYYEILNPPDQNANLLNQNDYINLSNQNQNIYLCYWYQSYQQVRNYSTFYIRKGNSKFSIFINDTEYKLKLTTQGEKRQTTKKPHPSVEKDWDEKVRNFLLETETMREKIKEHLNNDLKHLHSNLFVSSKLAKIVESHIEETQKEIEKIEVGIREIQNSYKKLKDEEIITK